MQRGDWNTGYHEVHPHPRKEGPKDEENEPSQEEYIGRGSC